MKDYLEKMTPYKRQIFSNPFLYTGIAAKKAKAVAKNGSKNFDSSPIAIIALKNSLLVCFPLKSME